jgi:ABC-2 type transport system ATP-binding protein
MRQRIGIAQALINDPSLLFLDEPTSGLDPIAHRELRDIIVTVGRKGKTVFLSSHQLEDVEKVCSRVAIIHEGKLLAQGKISDLTAGQSVTIEGQDVPEPTIAKLKTLVANVEESHGRLRIPSAPPEQVNDLVDLIRSSKGTVVAVIPHRLSLEEVFVDTVIKAGGKVNLADMKDNEK